jgi:hypothetical protein
LFNEGQSFGKPTLKVLDFCGVEKLEEMALNVKIDLENIYKVAARNAEQRASEFNTILASGEHVKLGIKISHTSHPLIPNTYNLAFGPVNRAGIVDDKARLSHQNYSKVFSTVLFEAMAFLKQHPFDYVGIDGSDNARANMYYRCIQNNLAYLNTIFTISGINYYIRMLRQAADGNCDLDTEDIITVSKPIESREVMPSEKLYNYFIFNLKSSKKAISLDLKK